MKSKVLIILILGLIFLAGILGSYLIFRNYLKSKPKEISQIATESIAKISLEALKEKIDQKEVFYLIDLRSPEEYKKEHIPTAVLIPYPDLEKFKDKILKEAEVILYCRGEKCGTSLVAAKKLISWGYKDVKVLQGGVKDWQAKGWLLEVGIP